ncbi:sterol desaturase family protein, partial [Planktomarina temperata]|nr:sterol desaturase family protein [Planktomarina temperata]
EMFIRNVILMTLVAGGLHLYFYTFTKQGKALKYDARPLMISGQQFTLGGQIRDNIFWTIASGVTVWTAPKHSY